MSEFADLSQSLPIHFESSVFLRTCEARLSHAKILIMAPVGTPYSRGCFLFDVFFPSNYPNSPPKVNLMTTGGGTGMIFYKK